MTANQITTILNELGYEPNMVIPLENVSSIYMTTDGCLYPDESSLYEFKTGKNMNLVLVYDAHIENGEYVQDSTTPRAIISGSVIAGFTLVSEKHIKAPYTLPKAV